MPGRPGRRPARLVAAGGSFPGGNMVRARLVALVSVPVAVVVAAGVAWGGARAPAPGGASGERLAAAAASSNLLTNPGFESGLSGWTCSAASGVDGVVTSPVHSGAGALAGAASSSDDAQCTQQVSVQPSSA